MILEMLETGALAANCYIVGDNSNGSKREGMIIDPGAEAERILERVNDLELETKLIVLTHGHRDHIGALSELKEATGAEICLHTAEADVFQTKRSHFQQSPPPPDRWLNGGDTLEIGALRFLVLHTPGHTPGGICLWGEGVLFSGDTLFNFGIGRYDFPGSSGAQLMDSLHTKLMALPDNTIVYPGHGPSTTIGTERRGNPFLTGFFSP